MAVAPKQKQAELLRKMVPINTLGDDELSRLMESIEFETLQKGDYLFRRGDSENYNAYLLSGAIVLQTKSREVDRIYAGSDTARFPLAHQVPRKFNAIANTKSQVVRVDNRLLSELMNRSGGSDYEVSDFDAQATDDWMSQLLQSRVFQQIPASNIQGVMMQMEEQEVLAGEVVIRQGEEGDYFYLINRGTCSVLQTQDESGESLEVAQLGPGSSFGEEALLSDKPRGSTVVMLTDGVLLRLSKGDFIQYVKNPLGHKLSFETAQEQAGKGAVWLDVRPESEFAQGHLSGAVSLPFQLLRQRLSSLNSDKHYLVYCNDGHLSTTAAYLLLESGLHVSMLEGGISQLDRHLLVVEAGGNVIGMPSRVQGDGDKRLEQIRELQAKLEIAQRHAHEQSEQLTKLKQVLDKTKAKLAREKEEVAGAGEVEAGLKAEIASLREELKSSQSQFETVERRLSEARQSEDRLIKAEQDLEERGLKVDDLQSALAEKSRAEESLKQQLSNVEKSLGGTVKERDRASGELLSLQEQYATNKQILAEAEQEVVELEDRLARQDERQKQQDAEMQEMQRRLDEEQRKQAGLGGELEQKAESERQTQEALSSAQARITKLESQLAEQESLHKEQQAAREDEIRQLTDARQRLEEITAGKGDVEAELRRAREELDQQKASHEQILQELKCELSEVAVASEEVAHLQSQLEGLRVDLEREQTAHQDATASLDRLSQEKAMLQEALDGAQGEVADLSRAREQDAVAVDELDRLREALDEAARQRETAEQRVGELTSQLAEQRHDHAESERLEAEHEHLKLALEAAESNSQKESARIQALESERNELAQTLDQLREEQAQASGVEARAAEMADEIASLQAQLQQAAAPDDDESEDVAALQAELELVRSQANADLEALQQQLEEERCKQADASTSSEQDVELLTRQLEELRAQLDAREDGGITENALLHQEIEGLKRTVSEREEKIAEFDKSLRRLDEQIEDSNAAVDKHRQAMEAANVDLEEAQFRAQEAEDARKQVEEALYLLQQQMESQRTKDFHAGLMDDFAPPPEHSGGSRRMGAVGVILGAVIAFGVAEGMAIMGGGGELITGLLSTEPAQKIKRPTPVPKSDSAPGQAPPPVVVKSTSSQPKASQAQKPQPAKVAAVLPEQKAAAKIPQARVLEPDRLRNGAKAPTLILLSGGEFTMGSNRSNLAQEERPEHKVAVKGFAIGRNEVTFAEYKIFADATQRSLPNDQGWGRANRPVMNVSWKDAKAYVEWLSQNTGKSYRLPSEAEWEYAASAGTDTLYWWGYDLGSNRANCFNCGSRWDGRSTAPVGQFKSNPFGLNNTAGNVMEWVADCYHPDYKGAPTDGDAWVEAGCRERVVRGGAFNKSGDSLRTTKRTPYAADARLFVVGFRVARDMDE